MKSATKDFIFKKMASGQVDKNYLLLNLINIYRQKTIPMLLNDINLLKHLGEELVETDMKLADIQINL